MTSYSDLELIERFRQEQDPGYVGVLYKRYAQLVYGVCLKVLKDREEAQDAFMSVFERLTEQLKTQEIKDFRPWLYVVTKNYCYGELRKQKRERSLNQEAALGYSEVVFDPFDGENHLNGQLEAMKECLRNLDQSQQRCIDLFYYQGKSYKEIAETQNADLGRIRSYIQNGKRKLGICINKRLSHG